MLINLNLLCRTLALFTLYRLTAADQNVNYHLPRNSLDSHYAVRFLKPATLVAAATLEDGNDFSTNAYSSNGPEAASSLSELGPHEESLDENDSNASLHTEFSNPTEETGFVVQTGLSDSAQDVGQNEHPDAVQSDLEPNHSNNEPSHRLVRRKDDKNEQPKSVIEFNSLDDQPTYSELNDAKNEEDDNGLLKYKAKHDFEYSTNLLNDHSYFFKNAKMLGE